MYLHPSPPHLSPAFPSCSLSAPQCSLHTTSGVARGRDTNHRERRIARHCVQYFLQYYVHNRNIKLETHTFRNRIFAHS